MEVVRSSACDSNNKLASLWNRFNVKSIQPWATTDNEFNRLVPATDAINVWRIHLPFDFTSHLAYIVRQTSNTQSSRFSFECWFSNFFFFFLDRSIFENNSFDAIKKEFPSRDLSIRFTIFHYLFFYRIFKFSSVFLRANNVIKLGLETMREFFPVVDNSFFETWKRKMGK